MPEKCQLPLDTAEKTVSAGNSLSRTLYGLPVQIGVTGELGAGKTTFLQGFARGLGIKNVVDSPTYALEQHHTTGAGEKFRHIDLYRLSESEAGRFYRELESLGITCIEWPERLGPDWRERMDIVIELTDAGAGRNLHVMWNDIEIPNERHVEDWRRQTLLPSHIQEHCDAVASLCDDLSDDLLQRGVIVRKFALHQAARLHDILRFIDFKPGAGPSEPTDEPVWAGYQKKYVGLTHEAAAALFLQDAGFPAIADIIQTHGSRVSPEPDTATVEQLLLYYADKRLKMTERVSLDERFEDFRERYNHGQMTPDAYNWLERAKIVERWLFPDGAPA